MFIDVFVKSIKKNAMDETFAKNTFGRLIPIASGESLESPFYSNPNAALEALVFFRGRFAPFDFALRNSSDRGVERMNSFVDSAARATEDFALDVNEASPEYQGSEGLEKAFAVRQHITERLLKLGSLVFPKPELVEKTNRGTFYDETVITAAAEKMRQQVEAIAPLQSFWLYGSALQTERLPGDLDFKAVTKEPLSFEQYAELLKIRMTVMLGGQERPAGFSLMDEKTWQAIYPLEETFWNQTLAWNFSSDSRVFSHPEANAIQTKTKLMQEMINLYRMAKKLNNPEERPELIRLATEIPDILKARVRNVNILAQSLQTLGVQDIKDDYVFAPDGTVEEKLEAATAEFYRLSSMTPADI